MSAYAMTFGADGGGGQAALFVPRGGPRGRRGVIVGHQVGGSAQLYCDSVRAPGAYGVVSALALAGFTCYVGDLGGTSTWGNDTAMTRTTAARTALVNAGCAPDKVGLVGVSMGGLTCLDWALLNPSLVAAFVGILPVVDPDDIRTNNRDAADNLRGLINAAYGLPSAATPATNPLPSRVNPSSSTNLTMLGQSGIPMTLLTSAIDPIVVPAAVSAFQAGVNAAAPKGTALVTVNQYDSTYGHTDAGIGAAPIGQIIGQLSAAGC